jgi:large exoprotein involved in heme utilization and adhesion
VTDFLSSINAKTYGKGDGGLININATKSITLDSLGEISTSVTSDGEGNGGNINITTTNLSLTNGGQVDAGTSGQGDGGSITIDVANTLNIKDSGTVKATFLDVPLDYSASTGIYASNQSDGKGDAGNINITASKLSLINGGQINSFTRGKGNAGNTTINAQDSIVLSGEDSEGDGFPSAILNGAYETAKGNGGTISITTKNLDILDGANISAFSEGQGNAGLIDINANVLSLDNGEISAEAFNDANGGNLAIDANFIVAYPNGNSDIFASAEKGEGGNINIDAESVFGIEERPLNDSTNDINASSEFDLDGSININTSDINPVQGATELPSNVVEAKQTTDQTCSANREGKANNGLAIAGRGGVHPAPDAPLNSENINNENPAQASIPQPLETSQGKIQPARGIKVTKSGKIILTAYRTNNAGERIPEIKPNCN